MTTEPTTPAGIKELQDARRVALIKRLGTIADLACTKPLKGELGDVAYDLLRQAAAQIASDRGHLARTPLPNPGYADGDYVLPCDVRFPPATVIKAGCTLATLKLAMEAEYRPQHFAASPTSASVTREVDAALNRALASSTDLVEMLPTPAPGLSREAVARIIDPELWRECDRDVRSDMIAAVCDDSLTKADAILVLLPANASETERVRNEALEEAAKVAEALFLSDNPSERTFGGFDIAIAIRALHSTTDAGNGGE